MPHQPWSPKPLPPLPGRSFPVSGIPPSQQQSESPTTNSFTAMLQGCNDPWILTTMLRVIADATLECGFRYYNSRGERLTTTRAIIECLEREGRVTCKGRDTKKRSGDISLTPIRD